MAQIPFIGAGNHGRSTNVTAQKRVNLFLDVKQENDKAPIVAYGTPGLTLLSEISGGPSRGMYWAQSVNRLYTVHGNSLYSLNSIGTAALIGTIGTTSGNVSMADNGFQLLLVDGNSGYILDFATSGFGVIGSVGFPYGASVCTFLDSYFVVNRKDTAQFYISAQYDGTTWNALDFATAESVPDNVVNLAADNGVLILMGEISTEFWQNSGANDFPFIRISGSTQEGGLAARFTPQRCAGQLIVLAQSRKGGPTVSSLSGYQFQRVSTNDIDYRLLQLSVVSDAVAFSYIQNGHHFYQLTFPTDGVTFLYDATSQVWSELQSNGITRHRAQFGAAYANGIFVSDYANGNIYLLDDTNYTDNGALITREIVFPHNWARNSLNNTALNRLRLDMEGGVGLISGQGSAPQVMLQISRDGGHTYGNELWTDIGSTGEYTRYAEWRRLGVARDWVFKLRITDPVKVVMIGAYADFREENK